MTMTVSCIQRRRIELAQGEVNCFSWAYGSSSTVIFHPLNEAILQEFLLLKMVIKLGIKAFNSVHIWVIRSELNIRCVAAFCLVNNILNRSKFDCLLACLLNDPLAWFRAEGQPMARVLHCYLQTLIHEICNQTKQNNVSLNIAIRS